MHIAVSFLPVPEDKWCCISLTLAFMFPVPRCGVCLPVAQSCAQWPRSVDAGHPPPAPGAGLQEPGPPAPPSGWLDQGWRCAPGLADEAARSCARRRGPGSQVNHRCHLPISHAVCWPHRGEQFLSWAVGLKSAGSNFMYKSQWVSGLFLHHEQVLKSGLSSLSNLIMFPLNAYKSARNIKSSLLHTAFENIEGGT